MAEVNDGEVLLEGGIERLDDIAVSVENRRAAVEGDDLLSQVANADRLHDYLLARTLAWFLYDGEGRGIATYGEIAPCHPVAQTDLVHLVAYVELNAIPHHGDARVVETDDAHVLLVGKRIREDERIRAGFEGPVYHALNSRLGEGGATLYNLDLPDAELEP